MRATVIIPTYRRPADLVRCLAALRVQTMVPALILVTVRDDDVATSDLVDQSAMEWGVLRKVPVKRAGVVAAMKAALGFAEGDVTALTDDDAAPYPDWLARLCAAIEESPEIGGAGGLDEQDGVSHTLTDVGRVQWFGRVVGNHHRGIGPARDVDVLKGVCCAFRTAPLRDIGFDERLRGTGAQMHWELSLCLAMRRAGWRLRYDPAIRVKHSVSVRSGDDQLHRGGFSESALYDAVYNETLAIAEHLSRGSNTAFRVWSTGVGTVDSPGFLQLVRLAVREGSLAVERWNVARRARSDALRFVNESSR